jgi:hypothetical protein
MRKSDLNVTTYKKLVKDRSICNMGKAVRSRTPLKWGQALFVERALNFHNCDILNERFSTDFKPADQLFFDSIREDAVADPRLRQTALANTMENFSYIFRKELESLFIDRMEQNEEITAKYLNEKDFRQVVRQTLLKQVYEQIHEENRLQKSGTST